MAQLRALANLRVERSARPDPANTQKLVALRAIPSLLVVLRRDPDVARAQSLAG